MAAKKKAKQPASKKAATKATSKASKSDKWLPIYRKVLTRYQRDLEFRKEFRKDPHAHLARHGKIAAHRLPQKVKAAVAKINWNATESSVRSAKVKAEAW
jgi:hypothetical protein